MPNEPKQFVAGETVEWSVDLSGFPSSEWTLTYHFRSRADGFDVTAAAEPDGTFSVSIPTVTTIGKKPGAYRWQAFAKRGAETRSVGAGTTTLTANLSATATFDDRSEEEKILAAIDARLSGKLTKDVQSITIKGRQVQRYSLGELRELRKDFAAIVAAQRRDKANRKRGVVRTIPISFGG